jgi:hypothetical protein
MVSISARRANSMQTMTCTSPDAGVSFPLLAIFLDTRVHLRQGLRGQDLSEKNEP